MGSLKVLCRAGGGGSGEGLGDTGEQGPGSDPQILTSCVTLDKSLGALRAQFPQLKTSGWRSCLQKMLSSSVCGGFHHRFLGPELPRTGPGRGAGSVCLKSSLVICQVARLGCCQGHFQPCHSRNQKLQSPGTQAQVSFI